MLCNPTDMNTLLVAGPFSLFLSAYKLSMVYRQLLFKVVSVLSLVIAAYHFVGIFYQINSSPSWRHALFVCICLFCYYGFAKRPKYFIYIFLALSVQQFY